MVRCWDQGQSEKLKIELSGSTFLSIHEALDSVPKTANLTLPPNCWDWGMHHHQLAPFLLIHQSEASLLGFLLTYTCVWERENTTCSWFSPSATWVPGTQLKCIRHFIKRLCPLNQSASPRPPFTKNFKWEEKIVVKLFHNLNISCLWVRGQPSLQSKF